MDYTKRQNRLIKLLESKNLDALLVRKRQNISYLTGIRGEDAIFFISGSKNFLITDSRYEGEYSKSIKNYHLIIIKNRDLSGLIDEIVKETHAKRIGFESNNFSYLDYISLNRKLKNKKLAPVRDLVESLRIIKDNDEIMLIKDACRRGCEIMSYALKGVKESISELALAQRIEAHIIKKALKRADFDIIVASGRNASMPHAAPSRKKIRKKEMVVIDLGVMSYGYNSDLTRTIFLDKIDSDSLRIYNIVLEAQKKAIENIKRGVEVKNIDSVSRQYISDKGLGKYFIHNLGHGIGLETHEKPYLSSTNNVILEKNMVITIEPGIYIPGWGGIRIEDDILVDDNGCQILTEGCKRSYACRN